ncbi:UNVERIFIED_CONTAM: hypothetical protein NCL1_20731 [Trichonephila clavipes]
MATGSSLTQNYSRSQSIIKKSKISSSVLSTPHTTAKKLSRLKIISNQQRMVIINWISTKI